MRRSLIVGGTILLIELIAVAGLAQQDKLAGRWEGKVQAPQGERPAVLIFKKEGSGYTGTISGLRPNSEAQLKEVKVEGDKVTAKTEAETPQGNVVINYSFTLQGDSLKGTGAIDFGGQSFSFDFDLKRVSEQAAAGAPAAPAQGQTQQPTQQPTQEQPPRQRRDVPQPQQKQSIDYFVGQWSFKYIGRESPLGPAPREGLITFTKRQDGRTLDSRTEGKSEAGPYKESAVITFDEATKMMTFAERLANGAQLSSRGDWSSPISIRFTIEPIKIKGQTLQLRRTISVISAHSFSVLEELSEDDGPFVRLGNAVFTKVGAK
jgi:hypothetical protein